MFESEEILFSNEWGFEVDLPNTKKLKTTPHFIGGRYPCRSVAYIPYNLLKRYSSEVSKKDFFVMDPFMGSGTTAIEANKFTKNIFGIEIDPYARLIATTSTTKYIDIDVEKIKSIVSRIENDWHNIKPNDDLKPSLKNIDYWFDDVSYLNLLKLKTKILEESGSDNKISNLMLVAFADIIRGCSLAERQSLKPYISKKFRNEPKEVLKSYLKSIASYLDCIEYSFNNLSDKINWAGHDATNFKVNKKLDIAITSPPYINALDYTRCIKIESSWLGTIDDSSIVDIRNGQIGEGARVKKVTVDSLVEEIVSPYIIKIKEQDPKRSKIILSYFQDMSSNLKSMNEALSDSAEYHLIIGNSTIRNEHIPTHEIIAELSKNLNYEWSRYFKYPIKDHRTSIPRNGNGGKINFEHVISLKKVPHK